MSVSRPQLAVIVGPTASGKTSAALELATYKKITVISADSRAIYKELDIGTAKPLPAEQAQVKHYGLDLITPGERFSAYQFQQYTFNAIRESHEQGLTPVIVGGTGMYVASVLYEFKFRKKGDDGYENLPLPRLQQLLREKYPELIEKLDINNPRRLLRALQSGEAGQAADWQLPPNAVIVGIFPGWEELRDRIAVRNNQMLQSGLVEEVERLLKKYGQVDQLGSVLYKQVFDMLRGEYGQDELLEHMNTAAWRMAKRQMTWFRRDPNIHWVGTPEEAVSYLTDKL